MDLAGPVPAQDYRLFPHAGYKVVTGFCHLAFVSYEQPDPGKNLFLLAGVDLVVYENFPADVTVGQIDQIGCAEGLGRRCHLKHPASQLQTKGSGGFEAYRFFQGPP